MGRSGPDERLREIGTLIGLPSAFSMWCGRNDVGDVPAFLHAEIDGRAPGPQRLWAALQLALRRARALAVRGDREGAIAEVGQLLERPGFLAGDRSLSALVAAGKIVDNIDGAAYPASPRGELLRVGGLAGARYLAERMSEIEGQEVTVRDIRDRLRHSHGAVRKLGGGYYAVRHHPAGPVAHWVAEHLRGGSPVAISHVVDAILAEYPYGDRAAVAAWLRQDPTGIRVRGDLVTVHTRAHVA